MAKLSGTEGNDTITGSNSPDYILARGGNDTVNGQDGDDFIAFGAGSDTVLGGNGNDLIVQGDISSSGIITHAGLAETSPVIHVDGGAGNDFVVAIYAGDGSEIKGGEGVDFISFDEDYFTPGRNGAPAVSGFEYWSLDGNYSVLEVDGVLRDSGDIAREYTYNGTPPLFGLAEDVFSPIIITNHNVEGLAGKLQIGGSFDIDASSVTEGNGIVVRAGNFVYDQHVTGSQLADEYYGKYSNDFFDGQAGDDFFDGKDGIDTAVYSGNASDYTVTEVTYNEFSITDSRGIDGTDTIVDVNKLQFADQTVDVVIKGMEIIGEDDPETLDGGDNADHIDGQGGDDTLEGNGGNDLMEGGVGNDSVVGGDGNDLIQGGNGNDTLVGGIGSDVLTGGIGDDIYDLGSDDDIVEEDDAAAAKASSGHAMKAMHASESHGDTILSTISRDLSSYQNIENLVLQGSADIDGSGNALANTLTGNGGRNHLDGGDGNDLIDGGAGSDTLAGGAGDDTYILGTGDKIIEDVGAGNDTIETSSKRLAIAANVENLIQTGASGQQNSGNALGNTMNANQHGGILLGLGGSDTLVGGAGNDKLVGGIGSDLLTGGKGKDNFAYASATESGKQHDTISDFTHKQDKFDFSTLKLPKHGEFALIGDSKFGHHAGEIQVVEHDAKGTAHDYTMVGVDLDGGGKADLQIELTGLVAVDGHDFNF